jgi:hypothetical protein
MLTQELFLSTGPDNISVASGTKTQIDRAPRPRDTPDVSLNFLSFKAELKTGDGNSLKLSACKFDSIGENLLTAGVVFSIKDNKWRPIASVQYATDTTPFPKPAWGSKLGDP